MILAVAAPTLFYRSQFWRLQKRFKLDGDRAKGFIGHNFGDYKNSQFISHKLLRVLSVTILETTKTLQTRWIYVEGCYRSQFWRLHKRFILDGDRAKGCIGHNFGDYKNIVASVYMVSVVLSVTILETTKTLRLSATNCLEFYRSQFWRLQKHCLICLNAELRFIGHNIGDYKNTV